METTLGFIRLLFVAAACLSITACNQNETALPTEVSRQSTDSSDAVENWMEKRAERRKAALSKPKGVASPAVKTTPVEIKKPVALTKAPPAIAIPAPAPTIAEQKINNPIQPIAESAFPSSKGQSVATQLSDISNHLELGYSAWDQGNYNDAFQWFSKAAELGNSEAQMTVGIMYASGEGVPQNYEEGLKWLTLALQKGDLNAQQLLGLKQFLNALQELNVTEEHQSAGNEQQLAATAPPPFPSLNTGRLMEKAIPTPAPLAPIPTSPFRPSAAMSVEYQALMRQTERTYAISATQAVEQQLGGQLGSERYEGQKRGRIGEWTRKK